MTSSADVYGIIPKKSGGYVLAKTKFTEGVERVDTATLQRMMRKDHTLHFVSFGFEEVDMMHERFDEDGKLVSCMGHHLVPIAVFGSMRTNEHVSIMLDGSDFKRFEPNMQKRGACFEAFLCMEGLSQMAQDGAKDWHTKLEVAQ